MSAGLPTVQLIESGGWLVAGVVSDDDWRVNCWVVRGRSARDAAVIDCGATLEQVREALAAVDGVAARILLTHGHHDHVTHARAISEALELAVEVHDADRRLVRQAAAYGARFSGRMIRTPQRVEPLPASGGITLGDARLDIHPAPGHTAGGVAFVAEGFVVTGDTLLREKVGRTDLPGGDLEALRATVHRLVTAYPAEWRILPGHGATWTVGEARAWWETARHAPPALDAFDA